MFWTFFFHLSDDYIDYQINNVVIQYRVNYPHYRSSEVLITYFHFCFILLYVMVNLVCLDFGLLF